MSHLKERKEKNCLNCQAALIGHYCHICGQENIEPKETVWHLVSHFFNDITHFDGKFFNSVKFLLIKPGYLSSEYIVGRRASYLNPIRMYVFTSAFFFLCLFSTRNDELVHVAVMQPEKVESIKDWEKQKMDLQRKLQGNSDEDEIPNMQEQLANLNRELKAARKKYGDTSTRTFSQQQKALLLISAYTDSFGYGQKNQKMPGPLSQGSNYASNDSDETGLPKNYGGHFQTAEAYDSAQTLLPPGQRDGMIHAYIVRKMITMNGQYKQDKKGYLNHIGQNFLHSFPKILFFSLPFFALVLKLVYVRRKQYYYVDHLIFTIHLYCAIFIFLLFFLLSTQIGGAVTWKWVHAVLIIFNIGLWIYICIYGYQAMRGFYKQGRAKTFLKYLIVSSLAFIVNLILMLFFLIISVVSA